MRHAGCPPWQVGPQSPEWEERGISIVLRARLGLLISMALLKPSSPFLLGPRQATAGVAPHLTESSNQAHAEPFYYGPEAWHHISFIFPTLTVQPWTSNFTSLGVSLAFSKVILIRSTPWGYCGDPLRTTGRNSY